jgi:hypothetical protein
MKGAAPMVAKAAAAVSSNTANLQQADAHERGMPTWRAARGAMDFGLEQKTIVSGRHLGLRRVMVTVRDRV